MGKTLAFTSAIQYYTRLASAKISSWTTRLPLRSSSSALLASTSLITRSHRNRMDTTKDAKDQEVRVPLSEVVADCVRRWFNEALKEARAGDTSMQVLVGQMYHSGYGVPKNDQKARAWIEKASRYRSSVWKVSDKRPGYNASDSDSDEEPDKK